MLKVSDSSWFFFVIWTNDSLYWELGVYECIFYVQQYSVEREDFPQYFIQKLRKKWIQSVANAAQQCDMRWCNIQCTICTGIVKWVKCNRSSLPGYDVTEHLFPFLTKFNRFYRIFFSYFPSILVVIPFFPQYSRFPI